MNRHITENKAAHRNGEGITVLRKTIPSPSVLISRRFADTVLFLKQNWTKVSSTSVKIRNNNIFKVTCFLTAILLLLKLKNSFNSSWESKLLSSLFVYSLSANTPWLATGMKPKS
ncbi:MAG: hypothetical protein Q8O13_05555 [Candidatus Omnitrophota bacterium]|nr:hypothetical protein [Candidatus Omnitrophota bacterium]